ncbi:MAG: hypothetical protein RSE46_02440 [Janthinobacterium sp.]
MRDRFGGCAMAIKKHTTFGCVLFFRPAPTTLKQARQRQVPLAIAFSIPTFEPWARRRMTLHASARIF